MKRREFITLLGGAVTAAWPLAARAQERTRRVGIIYGAGTDADDLDLKARSTAIRQALQALGWTRDRNVQIDERAALGNAESIRRYAAEIVSLSPDVILAGGASVVAPLLQTTRTVPVVFTGVVDPVGAGFVDSMAQPGGNATGFIMFEYGLSAKWLELLKEIAPEVTRVAVLRDAAISAGTGQFAAIQTAAPLQKVEISAINVRDVKEIERVVAAFARVPNGGLIATASALTVTHRNLIIGLVARHKLPAIFHRRAFVTGGGLMSYGANILDLHRRAAGYVDRILKGEKPADLPVQQPTQFELVINLQTAKALGLTMPQTLLARADEVIE